MMALAAHSRHPVGMLWGLLVWAAHFLASYVLLSVGCRLGWQHPPLAGLDPVRWLLLGLSAVAVVALVVLGRGAWSALRREDGGFYPLTAFGLDLLSLIAVVWLGMAVLFMPPCD